MCLCLCTDKGKNGGRACLTATSSRWAKDVDNYFQFKNKGAEHEAPSWRRERKKSASVFCQYTMYLTQRLVFQVQFPACLLSPDSSGNVWSSLASCPLKKVLRSPIFHRRVEKKQLIHPMETWLFAQFLSPPSNAIKQEIEKKMQ